MKEVPFFPNPDNLHCVQASFMMVVKYFMPDFSISWDNWSKITGFEEEKGTWALASLQWLNNQSFDINVIEKFDYNLFSERGGDYLKQIFPLQEYEYAMSHTNMYLEQIRSRQLAKLNIFTNRHPSLNDIRRGIDNGFLVRAHVDYQKLNKLPGYSGHSIVIYDYNDNGIYFHDPGPEPRPKRYEKNEHMEMAMFGEDRLQGEINLIKLKPQND